MTAVDDNKVDFPDEFDFDMDGCWNCAGEGYVSSCVSEYAFIDPESGCDLCTRRCEICNRPTQRMPVT